MFIMKDKFTALAAAALFFAAPVTVFADDYEPYDNSSRAVHVELYAGYGTPSVIPYFVEILPDFFAQTIILFLQNWDLCLILSQPVELLTDFN